MTSNRASVPDIRDPAILKGRYAGGTRSARRLHAWGPGYAPDAVPLARRARAAYALQRDRGLRLQAATFRLVVIW